MKRCSFRMKVDDIDLNYFLNSNILDDRSIPIWDVNNMNIRSRDPVAFDLEAMKIADGSSTSKEKEEKKIRGRHFVDYPKYKCEICNVDVPTRYRAQHETSPKHRICTSITNISAARRNSAETAVQYTGDTLPTGEIYFCEACSTVIHQLDREIHESSLIHYKSLLHDRFLNDLLMIFKDKDYLDTADFEYLLKFERFDKAYNAKYSFEDLNIGKNASSFGENKNEFNRNSDDNNNSKVGKLDRKDVNPNSDVRKAESSKQTDCDRTVTRHLYDVKYDSGNEIMVIVTPESFLLEVPANNYNALYTEDRQTVCRACRVIVREPAYKHVLVQTHVEKTRTPFENMHCFRLIDSRFKHCVLCNEVFINTSTHGCLKTHVTNLVRAISLSVPLSSNLTLTDVRDTITDLIRLYIVPQKFAPVNDGTQPYDTSRLIRRAKERKSRYVDKDRSTERNDGNPAAAKSNETDKVKQDYVKAKKEQGSSAKVGNAGDVLNNIADVRNINVLRSFCDTCRTYINTREFIAHLTTPLHRENARMKAEERAFVKDMKVTMVEATMGAVEKNLTLIARNLDSVKVDVELMEKNRQMVARISLLLEKILAGSKPGG